ncbi:MAG: hypothetical protein H5T62_11005 [Anaerolineae bacterium]|nr:hypothetical protein [Anaerolineae bacterium]
MNEQRRTDLSTSPGNGSNPRKERWVSMSTLLIATTLILGAALFLAFRLTRVPYEEVRHTEEINLEGGGKVHIIYPRLLGWRESGVNPEKRITVSVRETTSATTPVTLVIIPPERGPRLVSAQGEPLDGRVPISPTNSAVHETDLYLQLLDLDAPPPWEFQVKIIPPIAQPQPLIIARESWPAGVLRRAYNSIPWGTYLVAVLALVGTGLRWLWGRHQAAHKIIDQQTEQELLRAIRQKDESGQRTAVQKIKDNYERYWREGYVLGLRIPRQKALEAGYHLACAHETFLDFSKGIEDEPEFEQALQESAWRKERGKLEESWQQATTGYEKYGYAQRLQELRLVLLCWLENDATETDWQKRAARYGWASVADCALDLRDCLVTAEKQGKRFTRWLAADRLSEIYHACGDKKPDFDVEDVLKKVATDDDSWRVRKRAALRLIFAQKEPPPTTELQVRTATAQQVKTWMSNFARTFGYQAFASLSAELLDRRALEESFFDPYHLLSQLATIKSSTVVYVAKGGGATTLRTMLAHRLGGKDLVLSLTDWPQKADWSLETYIRALGLAAQRQLGQAPIFPWRGGYQEKLDALLDLASQHGYTRVCALVDNADKGPAAAVTDYANRIRPLLECPVFFQQPWLRWVLFLSDELESPLRETSAVEGGWVSIVPVRWHGPSPPTGPDSEPLLDLIDRRLQATTGGDVKGRDALITPKMEGRLRSEIEKLLAYWAKTPRQIVRFFDRLFQHRAALFAEGKSPYINELDLAAIIASMPEETVPPA